jgi:hypothetical protein
MAKKQAQFEAVNQNEILRQKCYDIFQVSSIMLQPIKGLSQLPFIYIRLQICTTYDFENSEIKEA